MNYYCRNCGINFEKKSLICPKCGTAVLKDRVNPKKALKSKWFSKLFLVMCLALSLFAFLFPICKGIYYYYFGVREVICFENCPVYIGVSAFFDYWGTYSFFLWQTYLISFFLIRHVINILSKY